MRHKLPRFLYTYLYHHPSLCTFTMASIHSLFDEITNEDAFAQPKQVPTL